MKINDDQAVMRSLYPEGRNFLRATMRNSDRTFTRFCQWCAGVRERVPNRNGLVCVQCDKAGPTDPIAARGPRNDV